jgi:hypothetical protein
MHTGGELRNALSAQQRTNSGEGKGGDGSRLREHVGEIGATAGVLGKQAVSNLRKAWHQLR